MQCIYKRNASTRFLVLYGKMLCSRVNEMLQACSQTHTRVLTRKNVFLSLGAGEDGVRSQTSDRLTLHRRWRETTHKNCIRFNQIVVFSIQQSLLTGVSESVEKVTDVTYLKSFRWTLVLMDSSLILLIRTNTQLLNSFAKTDQHGTSTV